MKKNLFVLISALLLCGCLENSEMKIKSGFDQAFPKRKKNIKWALGEEFALRILDDTINYLVRFHRPDRKNFIIDKKRGDTIFSGIVSKYRGLYYFSEQIDDTTYWIHAVKIQNNTIKGLGTGWYQMMAWDKKFEHLLENPDRQAILKSPVLKYIDREKKIIRLTPDKKALKEFYEPLLDSLPADTLIYRNISFPEVKIEENISVENIAEIISGLYPNPAKDYVKIMLHDEDLFQYAIYDISGKLIKKGKLAAQTNEIDVSALHNGSYFISIYPGDKQDTETVKLIIEK